MHYHWFTFADDDFEISPVVFYGQLNKVAKNVTLEEAQVAVSNLPDSDIEDDPDNDIHEGLIHVNGSQDDEDDQDDIPLSSLAEILRKRNQAYEQMVISWKKGIFSPPDSRFTPSDDNNDPPDENQSPLMYFSRYFPNNIFTELTEKTNMYALFKTGKILNAEEQEIKKLVAMHILMGVIHFPRLRMYWAPATRINFFDKVAMSRNRFETLRNNLHIVDINGDHNKTDKLWKVRPVIASFENRCEQLDLEENLCIDESIIPFKGQLIIKQYLRGKPNPWGVKVFMLCGASGIIYRSIVYQGSTTLPELEKHYSATNGLVIHLSNKIPNIHGYKLFCDNYFTSLLLLHELRNKGIFAAGTIRQNRLQKCPLKSENELKKMGRGSSDFSVSENNEIVAVRWYDNKCVNMASNFIGIDPEDEVRRWDRKKNEYVMVKRPAIIRMYNASMGGVDKSDFLIALYRTFIRSRKWTLRVIFHYFNLAVCNAWLEYQSDLHKNGVQKKGRMDLLHFTMSIVEGLAFAGYPPTAPKRGRPSSTCSSPRNSSPIQVKRQNLQRFVISDTRYDGVGHWPLHINGHEQRCKLEGCAGRSRISCEKCQVPLCLSKSKNCFKKFHLK